MAGAYDAVNEPLTIVKFYFNANNGVYVISMREYQNKPSKSDVINSYNDVPLEDGSIMGTF